MDTLNQYKKVRNECRQIFLAKTKDYGTSWRILRPISIVDQIYIKAWRIRSIQEGGGIQLVSDSIDDDFRGMVNYAFMALIQLEHPNPDPVETSLETVLQQYDEKAQLVEVLMIQKNHDYGEAWRDMTQESFVDLILTKLLRIKQIIENKGKTLISEGIDANFCDIANYALFALIKLRF